MNTGKIYTVSELNGRIRTLLEQRFAYLSVAGEITNLRQPYSGHIYFSLKDAQGQLKAVLFKMQQRYLEQDPADGQQVICSGRIGVYEPRGDYQLIVDTIDFHGAGALRAAFEQLKQKLDKEGLFDPAAKKEPPMLPRHITLVTSPRGAAVHDFIRIATRRFAGVRLAIYPVAVQGETAASEMVRAIERIERWNKTDVIVLCRGGGSMEDLMPYNDEQLARAIYRAGLPVVSAIGHEIDFTIADFVSDLRAPTPSAAAELLVPDRAELALRVNQLGKRLVRIQERHLERLREQLVTQRQRLKRIRTRIEMLMQVIDQRGQALVHAMQGQLARMERRLEQGRLLLEQRNPVARLEVARTRLDNLRSRLLRAMQSRLDLQAQRLEQQKILLDAVSPKNTLARGYAIMLDSAGRVVRASHQLTAGEMARVLLHRGSVHVKIEKVE